MRRSMRISPLFHETIKSAHRAKCRRTLPGHLPSSSEVLIATSATDSVLEIRPCAQTQATNAQLFSDPMEYFSGITVAFVRDFDYIKDESLGLFFPQRVKDSPLFE